MEITFNVRDLIRAVGFDFSKVKTDLTKLKNLSAIHSAFGIPQSERIVAFCKIHPLGITMGGCVFTDIAFYPYPKSVSTVTAGTRIPEGRVAYRDLSRFIIHWNGEKSPVLLYGDNKRYTAVDQSILFENKNGKEVYFSLNAIQKKLFETDEEAKKEHLTILSAIIDEGKMQLKSGAIDIKTKEALQRIVFHGLLNTEAAFVLAEDKYRSCSLSDYLFFVNGCDSILPQDRDALKADFNIFTSSFEEDLANPQISFSNEYLSLALSNLHNDNKSTEHTSLIKALLYARIGDIGSTNEAITHYRSNYSNGNGLLEKAEIISKISACKRMLEAAKAIQACEKLSKDVYKLTDVWGLTVLHYAIKMENADLVDALLKDETFRSACARSEETDTERLLSYRALAGFVGCKADVLYGSLEEVKAAEEEIKKLNFLIKDTKVKLGMAHVNLKTSEEVYKIAVKNNAYEKAEECRERIDELKEIIKDHELTISDYSADIKSYENDIEDSISSAKEEDIEFVNELEPDTPQLEAILEFYKRDRLYIIDRLENELNELNTML